MNQGRVWCVVNPTVGLPLFLGAVAVTSLIVHTAVLTHSGWYGAYVGANARTKTAMNESDSTKVAATTAPAFAVTISPSTDAAQPGAFVVTVTPNAVPGATSQVSVTASPDAPAVLASANVQ